MWSIACNPLRVLFDRPAVALPGELLECFPGREEEHCDESGRLYKTPLGETAGAPAVAGRRAGMNARAAHANHTMGLDSLRVPGPAGRLHAMARRKEKLGARKCMHSPRIPDCTGCCFPSSA